mmetsp:Transcript_9132/g.20970  ORF Transcript_9132/g.20970 Transcript_9132/m.20970 type:complete len:114 (+) Transcript_9132:441-782(+)
MIRRGQPSCRDDPCHIDPHLCRNVWMESISQKSAAHNLNEVYTAPRISIMVESEALLSQPPSLAGAREGFLEDRKSSRWFILNSLTMTTRSGNEMKDSANPSKVHHHWLITEK